MPCSTHADFMELPGDDGKSDGEAECTEAISREQISEMPGPDRGAWLQNPLSPKCLVRNRNTEMQGFNPGIVESSVLVGELPKLWQEQWEMAENRQPWCGHLSPPMISRDCVNRRTGIFSLVLLQGPFN